MDKQHLKYFGMFCHPYELDGMRSVNHLNIEVCWKPVVLFGKGTWKSPRKVEDMLPAYPGEKPETTGNSRWGWWNGCWRCSARRTT